MNKRGVVNPNPQSMIALLIFIIGMSMIIYIMFLPPADRAELLEQNRTYLDDGKKDTITELLEKEPGRLSNIAEDVVIRDLPAFNLYTRTDATKLIELDSIYIKKSLYEEQVWNTTFEIEDTANTDNFVLSFSAPKRNGMLTIILNDRIIFANELSSQSPSPIRIPKDLLDDSNYLSFQVSGPGIEFWKSNEMILEDLIISADYTDRTSQENRQTFMITEEEIDNLEYLDMRFVADCKSLETGPMEIYLNKRLIYSSVPDCGELIVVPTVDASRLRQGENDFVFRTERGNYLLYSIEIKLKLKQSIFPTYYFNLNEERYDKIQSGIADINLTLEFPNSIDRKKAVLMVNDYMAEIETYDGTYQRLISSFVREGNNAIEIRPKGDKIDILELRVFMAE
jgi:hypothetical protein